MSQTEVLHLSQLIDHPQASEIVDHLRAQGHARAQVGVAIVHVPGMPSLTGIGAASLLASALTTVAS